MKVLVIQEYRTSKKEPLGEMLRRLHSGLQQAGVEASFQFSCADAEIGKISPVARAVKKFPQLASLIVEQPVPGMAGLVPGITGNARQILSGDDSSLPFAQLAELADGVPRSFPFHMVTVLFTAGAFTVHQNPAMHPACGLAVHDSWWVNGRVRGLRCSYVVEVPDSVRKVPLPEGRLGVFLATLGKPRSSRPLPLMEGTDDPLVAKPEGVLSGAILGAILAGHSKDVPPELPALARRNRERLPELIRAAAMPHVIAEAHVPPAAHPLKPTLVKYFKPLGYSCTGGSGTFSLRRRTAANHVLEVQMDVGTWSRRLISHFHVHTPGFRFTLAMPVAAPVNGQLVNQCAIGDAERWDKIVANLAALTICFERETAEEISALAGPAPAWFEAPSE